MLTYISPTACLQGKVIAEVLFIRRPLESECGYSDCCQERHKYDGRRQKVCAVRLLAIRGSKGLRPLPKCLLTHYANTKCVLNLVAFNW